jgi:adenosylcobinamide kinase/adenosylcobinamide-phosphate guanylyltransferase
MLTLITGGARSGKSSFAQTLCDGAEPVTYIATARPEDEEMTERIARHRESRPASWTTLEVSIGLPEAVETSRSRIVLVDCVTVWLSNLLFEWQGQTHAEVEGRMRAAVSRLAAVSQGRHLVAVSNEVGFGIVPETPVGRQFRDLQGFVNQQLAQAAATVYLVVSGIPLRIKPQAGALS